MKCVHFYPPPVSPSIPLQKMSEQKWELSLSFADSLMSDAEFQSRLSSIEALPFREDFQSALYDLYSNATASQRAIARERHQAGMTESQKPWRNPTDFGRADLTRLQRMRQQLIAMSIRDGGPDDRDDLMSIAYCYHNLLLLGEDTDSVLLEVAEMSAPGFGKLLRGFVARSPELKSPEAFALKIEQGPDGPVASF